MEELVVDGDLDGGEAQVGGDSAGGEEGDGEGYSYSEAESQWRGSSC